MVKQTCAADEIKKLARDGSSSLLPAPPASLYFCNDCLGVSSDISHPSGDTSHQVPQVSNGEAVPQLALQICSRCQMINKI